ncbi:MAG TPA: beta-propeller domain-containing protein [Ilumatobacter sp.]|nr:beta-propeller domain-containing protein [Ilumatobacter sp.]
MQLRHAVPILCVAALAAACADDGPSAGVATPSPGTATGTPNAPNTTRTTGARTGGPAGFLRLAPFADCAEFLAHIHAEAADRVGPYGLDGHGGYWPLDDVDFAMEAAATDAPAATMAASMPDGESGAGSYTGTNVQEAGIDEADLIKTDGERIVAIADGTLYVVDPGLPGANVTGRVRFNHHAAELMLAGDRAFTFGTSWNDTGQQLATEITEISLADPTAPTVVATVTIDGSYLSSRLIGNRLRVAVSSAPDQMPFVVPGSPAGEQLAEQTNQRAIFESQLADWTPEYELNVAGEVVAGGPLTDCTNLHRPATFSGFDVLSVLDIDVAPGGEQGDASALATTFASGSRPGSVAVLGAGSTVYSSATRMYLATTRWVDERGNQTGWWSTEATTAVHAFAIDPVEPTRYVASGEVDGTLLSQFSLDEHDGNLRIVVTDHSANGATETRLAVFTEHGDELTEVGSVGGIGRGEQLYSARLIGDVGFAVTFRQIDPFYVLDLSDPTNPRVAGELKIPGMSTYLHPLGDVTETGLVLGIGQDSTDEGMPTGLKLSVFDVSDPANPTEIDKWVLPGGHSAAEYDHRAFQIVGDLAIVPIEFPTPGAQLLRVGADGVSEVGLIEHLSDDVETRSDCRLLTADDFPTEDSTFFWEVRSGGRVQVCGPNDNGGWDGSCGQWYPGDLVHAFFSTEAYDEAVARLGLGDDDRIEICYPNEWVPGIQRSLVIDEAIWTFSTARLQANAVDGLDVLAELALL